MHFRAASRRELAPAGIGAKVGSYHGVLAASSEHGMQDRQARSAAALARTRSVPLRSEKRDAPAELHRWEDDGGSVRKRAFVRRPTAQAGHWG